MVRVIQAGKSKDAQNPPGSNTSHHYMFNVR